LTFFYFKLCLTKLATWSAVSDMFKSNCNSLKMNLRSNLSFSVSLLHDFLRSFLRFHRNSATASEENLCSIGAGISIILSGTFAISELIYVLGLLRKR
jgi:hypothetical protein